MIKQLEAQLLLKLSDLSRQCRLSNAHAHRRFRYGAEFGDSNKGSQAPQIHALIVCLAGMDYQTNYALDISLLPQHLLQDAENIGSRAVSPGLRRARSTEQKAIRRSP